ncbi:MAG: type IX secretion system sortase PorU [Bacteroidaceae bacterium]|nr:type IX secretion system sortase PorU [Bacteroidaceae bacterium]
MRAVAQDYGIMETEWRLSENDSVAPWVGLSIPLYGSWPDTAYSAGIEFPELVPLSDETAARWGITVSDVPEWPEVESFIGVSRGSAVLEIGFVPVMKRDGRLMAVNSYKPVVNRGVMMRRVAPARSIAERYATESKLSHGRWVKIRIPETGVYRLTFSSLRSMGFNEPERVRLFGYGGAVLPETKLQDLVDDLPEQPLWHTGNALLFYGQGPVKWSRNYAGEYIHERNTYSDWGYYFLTDDASGEALQFSEAQADSVPGTVVRSFPDRYVYDPDEFSWYRSGRRLFESFDYSAGGSRSYAFQLDGIVGDSVLMTVAFSSDSDKDSRLAVSVNNTAVGSMSIGIKGGNDVAAVAEHSFTVRGMFTDQSSVRLVHEREGNPGGHLDFIRLNFMRRLSLYDGCTLFRTGSGMRNVSFSIDGSSAGVKVWRISSDGSMSVIPSIYEDGRTVTMASDYAADDELVAVDVTASLPEPVVVGEVMNQNLHGVGQADMVIVVPASGKLTAQAERLADAHRIKDGMSVEVVRADMIYNEFSSGTPDATAIRRFMKMLYDRSGDTVNAPENLLLMGDGAWDNRMLVSDWKGMSPDDFLLCYESYNSTSHTASFVMEDYYGLLDDGEGKSLLREKVDIGVGRLPVHTAAQAESMVNRIMDYMDGRNSGAWRNRILILGDDGDNNTHMRDADGVASIYRKLYPVLDQTKVYWDAFKMEVSASYNSYPSVRKLILEELDKGALIVNYTGHGSPDVLSHELVLNKADASSLTSPRLPFWITASCDIAPFDSPLESFGMNLMNNDKGGAIGLLSTTRTVYSSSNRVINNSYANYILDVDDDGKLNTLGRALRLAKNALVTSGSEYTDYSENKIHYVLLGDPALRLGMAQMTAVIDSFSHKSAFSDSLNAMAGSVIEVSGHIEFDSVRDSGFDGKLYMSVFDSEREVVCLDNARTANEPFTFMNRDRILFAGTDSVRHGEFRLSFPVPLDINYSDESGRISLYADRRDGKVSAAGFFENFRVGGTDLSLRSDTIGPSVSLYLNTPSFRYGGHVNSTPLFVADIFDESGLNTSGNGLGHDILLVIDNNPNYTWVLNNCFTSTDGGYTGGRVVFSLPSLPEGKHQLMFRVWDVMNNSSVRLLDFKVENGLKPEFTVEATSNPARENTTFVVTHDRPGQNAEITVRVFSTRGVMVWTGCTTQTSESGVSMISWDLCSSSGQRLQPGLYIISAEVKTPVEAESKGVVNGKLIIAGP